MSIDINEVSFKVNDNRWLEIWVGDQEVVSVDTVDGGLSLCRDADEIGNIIENDDGGFEFKGDDDVDRYNNILESIRNIERRL
jgi:hypothetical protein